jgi:hypothetical protein
MIILIEDYSIKRQVFLGKDKGGRVCLFNQYLKDIEKQIDNIIFTDLYSGNEIRIGKCELDYLIRLGTVL